MRQFIHFKIKFKCVKNNFRFSKFAQKNVTITKFLLLVITRNVVSSLLFKQGIVKC